MRYLSKSIQLMLAAALPALLLTPCAVAVVPSVVMSNHQTLYSSLTNGTSRVSANARGDVFFADPFNHELLELPAGSTTPVILLINTNSTTSTSGPNSVDVDSAGNVYFNNTYGGRVIRIPFVNGTYATGVDVTNATLKANTCSAGMTVDCVLPVIGALGGYYSQTSDTAIDGSGNYYQVDVDDSVSNGKYNRIVEISASGTQSILVDSLITASNAQIVSDAKGDLFYVNGTGLYNLPAGATTLTQINATTLSKPSGVTFDLYGNLLVSDSGNSRIVVIPLENGALNPTDQYLLAPQYSQNSVGIDSFGTIYYTASSGGASSISALQTSVYQAASLAVGSTTASALVYASFNASITFTTIYNHASGGTVLASVNSCILGTLYVAGKSCSLNTQIKPTQVGPVTGLVGVIDNTGIVQGQFALTTIGLGSAVAIDPGTAASIGSGFTLPQGIAVDRNGNVFVADPTAGTVYELVGGSGTPVAIGTSLSKPTGVAVDAAGDLFIADTGNQRVVEIPNLGTLQTAAQITLVSGLAAPISIATGPLDALYVAQAGQLARYEVRGIPPAVQTAVLSTLYAKPTALTLDPSGDIFLADQATGDLYELAAYTNAATVIATGLTSPTGLATDAAGDLFMVDSGTAQAVRIPNISGTLTYASAVPLGTFNTPTGLAVDGSGNAYVTDPSAPAVYKIARTFGALNFGEVNLNTTSPALSGTIVSSGNQALTLGTPLYTATGDTTHFTVSSATTCTAGQSLPAGSGCTIAATYTPATKTTTSDVLAINASPTVATTPFQLTLTGTGTFLEPTTLAVTYAPNAISYGQTATLTATLTPGAFNVAAATGPVTFYINGVAQKPVALANNIATLQTTSLTGGSNSVYAIYGGDLNYQGYTSSTISITVAQASTTTALTITTTFTNPTSSLTNSSLTLTALVMPSVAGVLSGSVTFTNGGVSLGSAPLNATPTGAYQASLTTSTLAAATYSVVASYPGNSNYSGSSSTAQPLIVSSAGIQLTSSSSSVTSSPSAAGSVSLYVASIAGLGSPTTVPVTFSCSGLPAYAVCRFTPAYISLSGSTVTSPIAPTVVGLTIQVGVAPGTPLPPVSSIQPARNGIVLATLFAMPFILLLRRHAFDRGALPLALLALLCLPATLWVTGCSAGGTSSSSTPAGNYPVTVKAISSTASASLTLNLKVTP